jgi:hypothetical protein
MRRARCPRCPWVAFSSPEIGSASRQMTGSWQDRADWSCLPVLGLVRESLAEVGKMPVQPGCLRSGRYPAHVLPGRRARASALAGRRLSGVPDRVQDGSRTVRCSWTQLDLMGHDPKPASRWPGTLRDYGRHTDRARYSRGGKWGNSRSVAIPMGRDRLTVKPSAKPTLVRTQHLPLPAETARELGIPGLAGCCF